MPQARDLLERKLAGLCKVWKVLRLLRPIPRTEKICFPGRAERPIKCRRHTLKAFFRSPTTTRYFLLFCTTFHTQLAQFSKSVFVTLVLSGTLRIQSESNQPKRGLFSLKSVEQSIDRFSQKKIRQYKTNKQNISIVLIGIQGIDLFQ